MQFAVKLCSFCDILCNLPFYPHAAQSYDHTANHTAHMAKYGAYAYDHGVFFFFFFFLG